MALAAVLWIVLALPGASELGATEEQGSVDHQGWSLRFYAAAIDFDDGARLAGGVEWSSNSDFDMGGGFGVNAEYRFSRRLGVDLGALAGAGVDFRARTSRGGETHVVYDSVSFTPLTAGLDVHLTPDSRVDVYLRPMVALIMYGQGVGWSEVDGFWSDVGFDDDIAPGLTVGLGVPFGDQRWSFEANVTYLDSSLSGRGLSGVPVERDYDMAILGVGFGYRF